MKLRNPVALKGKVPVKADCSVPIKKGDILVPSEKKGCAMSHEALEIEDFNSILRLINNNLGKALEDCKDEETIFAWVD